MLFERDIGDREKDTERLRDRETGRERERDREREMKTSTGRGHEACSLDRTASLHIPFSEIYGAALFKLSTKLYTASSSSCKF